PLVAFIDDVDGADASTMRLLAGLPGLLDDVPVLLLLAGRRAAGAASRTGDSAWFPADTEIVVNPLTPDESAELVRSIAPGLNDDEVDAVVAASAGRPAIVTALAQAGDPMHTLSAVLTAVDAAAASAVAVAWLAGGWLTDDEVATTAGLDLGLWTALLDRGVLVMSDRPARGAVPSSELWIDAARRILAGVLSPLAGRVAAALTGRSPSATIANCWEHAGRDADAASAWESAADEAEADLAIATAAVALRRSVELGGGASLLRLGRRAGELSLAAGDREDADRLGERLLPRLERNAAAQTIGVRMLRYRARSEAGLPGADEHLDAALRIDAPPCREHVDALVVDALRCVLDDPALAASRAAAAIEEARIIGDASASASALGAAGLADAISGDVHAALVHLDAAVDAAAGAGDSAAEARLASNRVYVLWRAGRPADVERAAAAELDRLAVRGMSAMGDQLAVGRAAALITLGRFDDAADAIALARRMRMATDATALLDLVDAELALVRGETDRAASLIDRASSSAARAVPEVAADLYLRQVDLALARGDRPTAAALALAGMDASGDSDAIAVGRLVLAWWRAAGRSGAPVPPFPEVRPIGAEAVALIAHIDAHHAGTVAAWLAAADAWAVVPNPLENWRCRLGAAMVTNDLAAIDALVDEARELTAFGPALEADAAWRAGGGRRSPRRTGGLLTERELEVLECVAQGLTNREVAERLFISARTVGAHLERCMAKLEVATRGAAVHEARRQGLMT
ncbi:MAG: regulatory protein LuxR, partial [Ilumatobacteraceae bacterium]|nr:regulatory protein LuxR [Ilumatobacteraceae bacterium]